MRERLTTATVAAGRLGALGDGVTGQPHIHQARKPRAYVLTGTIILIRKDWLTTLLLTGPGEQCL